MGYVTEYLNSPRLAQDLAKAMQSEQVEDLEYANRKMICSLLRWQQLFENPFVDREAIGLRAPTSLDFAQFRNEVLHLVTLPEPHVNGMRAESTAFMMGRTNDLLLQSAQKMMHGGADYDQRLIKLLTMGACEYHGFNSAFTDSIREHGLNPNAKFHNAEDIGPIHKILRKVNRDMGNVKRDQKMISVTPDPYVAHMHAKMSPEWFYYFTLGSANINHAYLNRDYDSARKNLLNFPGADKLNEHERNRLYQFFDEFWKKLALDQSPKIAVMPTLRDEKALQQKQMVHLKLLEQWGINKTTQHIFNGTLYSGYEHLHNQAIDPKFIQIVDIPTNKDLTQRLELVHGKYQHSHDVLKTNEKKLATVQDQTTPTSKRTAKTTFPLFNRGAGEKSRTRRAETEKTL